MAIKTIKKEEILLKLLGTFRTLGYEGTTLTKISEVTGLGKASLYHYFPEGKKQMIEEVLAYIDKWNEENIIQMLKGKEKPKKKIKNMMGILSDLYDGGNSGCIVGALTYSDMLPQCSAKLKDILLKWIQEMGNVLIDAGIDPKEASKRAEDTVAMIQGVLIVSRGIQKRSIFTRMLNNLPNELFL